MRLLTAILIALACTLTARAQESRQLTYIQIANLNAGLAALDGHLKIIKDGGQERAVIEPYDIGPGLRLVIAQNALKARNAITIYQKALGDLQKQYTIDSKIPDAKVTELNAEVQKLGNELSEEKFTPMRYEELKPQINNFPPSVLTNLLPILILDEKK